MPDDHREHGHKPYGARDYDHHHGHGAYRNDPNVIPSYTHWHYADGSWGGVGRKPEVEAAE